MNKRRPTIGLIYALIGAALFGLNASSTKVLVGSGITPSQVVILRSLANVLLAGAVMLATNRTSFRLKRHELPLLMLFSLVGVAIMQWAYTNAVSILPVGSALLFEYTAILFVPLASSILLKQSQSPMLWFGIVSVIAGLAVISGLSKNSLNPLGVAFAMLASVTLTVYFIVGGRLQRDRDSLSLLFYSMLISSGFWLVVNSASLAKNWAISPTLDLGGNLAGTILPTWMLLVWVAVAGSFLPMLFSYLALRNLSPTATGVASTAETIFAFLFGWLWLAQPVSAAQWIGGAFVVAGITAAQLARKAT